MHSERADGLVREIQASAGQREVNEPGRLLTRHDPWSRPDVSEVERVLTELRDRLRRDRRT